MSPSRRSFLQQVSAAAAIGLMHRVPGRRLWTMTPAELLPEPDESLLRTLAGTAVGAARGAGAAFADVRVTAGRQVWLEANVRPPGQRPTVQWPGLDTRTEYGIRAIVDGAWGFAGGSTLTAEAVAEVARTAVLRARANRPRRPRTLDLASVPPVKRGEWATPIEQDPFKVPLREQADLAIEALTAVERVRGLTDAVVGMNWTWQLRVFASSEGALIVQRVALAYPRAYAAGRLRAEYELGFDSVANVRTGGYGYEALGAKDLVDRVRKAAERAVANSRPDTSSSNPVQVGRYDVVFGGNAVVALVRTPLAEALNVERALGYRANREGTSFAAPPADILGKYQVGSPLVTLRADRTRPHGWTTVGWDDEGVAAGEHTLIKDGVIVDYLTTRQTAAELAMSRRDGGEAARSRGCATGVGQEWPEAGIPNLTLVPGKEAVSVDDIIADTKRGYYVPDVYTYDGADQQLLSGQFPGDGVREIRNGKLGRSVTHFAFQFITPQFWKKLDALGGPASMGEEWPVPARLPYREDPLRLRQDGLPHIWGSALSVPFVSVRAVPARVREVNVLNTGATQ